MPGTPARHRIMKHRLLIDDDEPDVYEGVFGFQDAWGESRRARSEWTRLDVPNHRVRHRNHCTARLLTLLHTYLELTQDGMLRS
jgi:hypothetical protein